MNAQHECPSGNRPGGNSIQQMSLQRFVEVREYKVPAENEIETALGLHLANVLFQETDSASVARLQAVPAAFL
jgi:hypothetical protein